MAFGPDNRFQTGASAWTQPFGRSAAVDAAQLDAGLRSYMLGVYNWMASGLLLTGIVAFLIVHTGASELFYQVVRTPRGNATVPTILGWVAMLSPLAFVLVLSFGINRMSKTTAQALFWAFCAVMGASISNILLIYTGASVASTFFITAAMFAGVSLYGYTTKADLTRMGSFMMMGLIGIPLGIWIPWAGALNRSGFHHAFCAHLEEPFRRRRNHSFTAGLACPDHQTGEGGRTPFPQPLKQWQGRCHLS